MNIARGRMGLGCRVDLLDILDKGQITIDVNPHDRTQAFDLRYRMVF